MMMRRSNIGTLLILLLCSSCIEPPSYPIEPVITEISLSKTSFSQFDESVRMYIDFTDGDGDIGSEDVDSSPVNLTMIDSRSQFEYTAKIPFIPANGNIEDISARLTVDIDQYTTCFPNKLQDTLFFSVQIIDQAGNLSNVVDTEQMIMICD